MGLKMLNFHINRKDGPAVVAFSHSHPEQGAFSSSGPVMVGFVHNSSEHGVFS